MTLSLPPAPEGLLNLTSFETPGFYVVGRSVFAVGNFPLTSIFHRSLLDSGESILLSFLAILSILLVFAVVHTVLQQQRFPFYSAGGIRIAVALHDLYCFRPFAAFCGPNSRNEHSARRRKSISYFIILIATILLVADVAMVYLTVPKYKNSSQNEYNLKGIQPVRATRMNANQELTSLNRSCLSPDISYARQRRNFVLRGCVEYEGTLLETTAVEKSQTVTVGSWYHAAGSDHILDFKDTSLSVKIRATVDLSGNRDSPWKILFESRDNQNQDHAQYLQEVVMYDVVMQTCLESSGTQACIDFENDVTRSSKKKTKSIVLWTDNENEDVLRNVTGIETTFTVGLEMRRRDLMDAMQTLSSSTAIEEVNGPGDYVNETGDEVTDIQGLISEMYRAGGIVLFVALIIALALTLFVSTVILRPVPMSQIFNQDATELPSSSLHLEDRQRLQEMGAQGDTEVFLGARSSSSAARNLNRLDEWNYAESYEAGSEDDVIGELRPVRSS